MICLSIFLLLLVLVFPAHSKQITPNNKALELADGRKFFCTNIGNIYNRTEADLLCRDRGMVLPIVKERAIMEQIRNHCKVHHVNKISNFWIDAELEPTSNKYKWSTGSIIDNSDPNWLKGFPKYNGKCVAWSRDFRPDIEDGRFIVEHGITDNFCGAYKKVVCEQRTQ